MAFGLSFGKKKQSSSTQGTATKNETVDQMQSTDSSTATTGTQNTTQTSSNLSQGTSATSQQTDQSTVGTSQQQQAGTTKSFSDQTLQGLDQVVSNLLSSVFGPGGDRAAVQESLAGMGSFNADEFVTQAVNAAASRQQSSMEEALGSLFSNIGGTSGTNSAAALLENRMASDANAALQGVASQAAETAQGIAGNRVGTTASALGSVGSGPLAALLAQLKGGVTETTQQAVEQTQQQQAGTNVGTTQTTEQSTQQQKTQTETMQLVNQLMQQILKGTTSTVATEDSTTKGKSGGFGASLGL